MLKRSRELWTAAFFLSQYGETGPGNHAIPPAEMGTNKWNEAYRMFYESLNAGRSISSFEHTLKNARDAYDSHLGKSKRAGWKDEDNKPNKLNGLSNSVLQECVMQNREKVWKLLESLVLGNVRALETSFNDVSTMQDSEHNSEIVTRTEGGKKMLTSFRYERKPSVRNAAFVHHGLDCVVCGFNFGRRYGSWGEGFAEVHHLMPLSETGGEKRQTNAATDLRVVCSNCHRMMHRKKGVTLTVEELRAKLIKVS